MISGLFFGEAKASDGSTLGWCQLLIDPDRTSGHVLFNEGGNGFINVASVSISTVNSDEILLNVFKSEMLENDYRISEEYRLPNEFRADVTIKNAELENAISGEWRSDGKTGTLKLFREVLGEETVAHQIFSDWDAFKGWANKYTSMQGAAFRGQGGRHRLCTSFHRTDRVDLVRYVREDLPIFADRLETELGGIYNLSSSTDFGAVIGLAQHHGFPTPLLDWTSSPYVAAYFAFAEVVAKREPPSHVRVFRLSADFVRKGMSTVTTHVIDPMPTVSAYSPPSRGNGRLLNQQGLFTFSNMLNIEEFLRKRETRLNMKLGTLLEVVDISSDQARRALADLRNMGTTAATLFAGLDGVATFLKHKQFFSPDQ
ncbi:FRG domain-containing protein [Paucibacter sp. hw8]|uniref:FRG domain-containing protein n=2 Tax=Roseateles albus TaxID=2987525 RepID=A0ABT5K7Q7_9BURK|nr:FRG domain-containing protein [Roseateles albus]